MSNDDQEPGWGALSVLLWPISAYVALKQWLRHQLHRDQEDER